MKTNYVKMFIMLIVAATFSIYQVQAQKGMSASNSLTTPLVALPYWALEGNGLTGGEFLGSVAGSPEPLVFVTNGVECARFLSTSSSTGGNFGIGTPTPSDLMHVYTNTAAEVEITKFQNANSSGSVEVAINRSQANRCSFLKYTTSGTNDWYVGESYALGTSNSAFTIGPDVTLANAKFTILPSGNVGIGTTTPNNLLQVAGLVDFDPNLYNTFLGTAAGQNMNANDNTGIGLYACGNLSYSSGNGTDNTAVGYESLISLCNGSNANTAVGSGTGGHVSGVTGVTLIGEGADLPYPNSNCTFLGYNGGTNWINGSNQMQLGNSNVTAIHVPVSALTYHSDRRIKNNIKENVPGLAFINLLKPVTFNIDLHKEISITGYPTKTVMTPGTPIATTTTDSLGNQVVSYSPGKPIPSTVIDTTFWPGKYNAEKITQTGLIAQQVDSAAQKIGYDFCGIDRPSDPSKQVYGLRYGDFIVPLIKAVQELSKKVDSLEVTNVKGATRNLNNGSNNDTIENKQNIILSLPDAPTLGEPQPNPNSGSTQIAYYLPQNTSDAKIIFTDMLGKVMDEKPLQAGYGLLNINTQNLPSGIYTYTLVIDGKVFDTKKMMRSK